MDFLKIKIFKQLSFSILYVKVSYYGFMFQCALINKVYHNLFHPTYLFGDKGLGHLL